MDARRGLLDLQHGGRLRGLLRPPAGRRASSLLARRARPAARCCGGRVEEGPRRVVLEPLGVSYDGSRLELSAAGCASRGGASEGLQQPASGGSSLKALWVGRIVFFDNSPRSPGRRGSRCRRAVKAPELPGSRRTCSSTEERHRCAEHPQFSPSLALGLLALPAVAGAAPTVKFKAEAVPIPGFKRTREHPRRRRRACTPKYTIEGTEYGGFPPPISGRELLPARRARSYTRRASRRAPRAVLEQTGHRPREVPGQSKRARSATCSGIVSFGSERVEENATLRVVLRPRRRPRVLHARPHAGVAGNPVGKAST